MSAGLLIAITSGGERIGTLTPEAFRAYLKPASTAFLPVVVQDFNAKKERDGEPERAEIIVSDVQTTCIEHAYGSATRLSFQVRVF